MPLGLGRCPGTQGQYNHATRYTAILWELLNEPPAEASTDTQPTGPLCGARSKEPEAATQELVILSTNILLYSVGAST